MVHTCFNCDLYMKETAEFYCTKDTLNLVSELCAASNETALS